MRKDLPESALPSLQKHQSHPDEEIAMLFENPEPVHSSDGSREEEQRGEGLAPIF
jgi:hypothetical protein